MPERPEARPVLAVAGLAREARIAAGPGVQTLQAGGRPVALRAALQARAGAPARAVVSFGIAGGLDPALAPGDLVVGAAVALPDGTRLPCDPGLAERLARRLAGLAGRRVILAPVAGVEAAVLMPGDKAALRARTQAAAVDMESHVAAAHAAERGLPFAVLRAVCDPAQRALPAFAAGALKPDGDPDIAAVLAALLRREVRIAELVRLARDSGAAFGTLSRARALLGLALGVDA